ncbi:MAG: hypothetical protein PHV18_00325 [Lachnospiraceae bacterium]|nr:hypothetical protein [Lachnospiraceae bacterium]
MRDHLAAVFGLGRKFVWWGAACFAFWGDVVLGCIFGDAFGKFLVNNLKIVQTAEGQQF